MADDSTSLTCGRCDSPLAAEDNFCRHCGLALNGRNLPSVRSGTNLPAAWQPSLPSTVVKGAAVVAAGTLAQRLARGLLRRALGGSSKPKAKPERRATELVARDDEPLDGAQFVSETVLMRRIRTRR